MLTEGDVSHAILTRPINELIWHDCMAVRMASIIHTSQLAS